MRNGANAPSPLPCHDHPLCPVALCGRSPLRKQRRNLAQQTRLQLSAELGLRKARLRRLGFAQEPALPAEIEQIRAQLTQSSSS